MLILLLLYKSSHSPINLVGVSEVIQPGNSIAKLVLVVSATPQYIEVPFCSFAVIFAVHHAAGALYWQYI